MFGGGASKSPPSPSHSAKKSEFTGGLGRWRVVSHRSRCRLRTYSSHNAPARWPRNLIYNQPGRKDSDHTANTSSESTPACGRTCNGGQASHHARKSTSATVAFMQILAQARRRPDAVLCGKPDDRLPPPGALWSQGPLRPPGALPPAGGLADGCCRASASG